MTGEVFDYLVSHGRMKEKEARAKFRQVGHIINEFYKSISINQKSERCKTKLYFLFFGVLKML